MRRAVLSSVIAIALIAGACGKGKSSSSGDTIGTSDAPAQEGPALATTSTVAGQDTGKVAFGRQIPAPWPAPTSNVVSYITKAGLPSYSGEKLAYHIHAHLDVFVDGETKPVAANLGIDNDAGAISPLHTHDTTGIVHIESDKSALFHLGQLFIEWNVRLDQSCVGSYCAPEKAVAAYVDGKKFSGDPADIELSAHREIALVIGTPPRSIPSSYDWPANI